jgi:hypothetical protein
MSQLTSSTAGKNVKKEEKEWIVGHNPDEKFENAVSSPQQDPSEDVVKGAKGMASLLVERARLVRTHLITPKVMAPLAGRLKETVEERGELFQ